MAEGTGLQTPAARRKDMVLGAATVFERVEWARGLDPTPHPPAAVLSTLTDAWIKAYAPGNPAALLRRLSWDSLDPSVIAHALAQANPALPAAAADWVGRLEGYLSELQHATGGEAVDGARAPFADLLRPAWVVAWREVELHTTPAARARITPAATATLRQQLLQDLAAHSELVLFDMFRRSRDGDAAPADPASTTAYARFVDQMRTGGMEALFHAYPVLARHLALIIDSWVTASAELLSRLDADAGALRETFGADADVAVRIEPGLSDPHNGRRRVARVTFASGLDLVYKPRDVRLDAAFASFLGELGTLGLDPVPLAAATLACEGYGWITFVNHEPLPNAEAAPDWYRRAGALLCIAHLLRGRDLHMENVIATARGPIIIDLELLLQPVTTRGRAGAAPVPDAAHAAAGTLCLATGFVSDLQTAPDGTLFDVGGLRGTGEGMTPVSRRTWTHLGSDALACTTEPQFNITPNNLPTMDGQPVAAEDYVDDVLAGFEAAYRVIDQHRHALVATGGLLERFSGLPTRVIGRPTDQYAAMLHLLAAPRYQQNGAVRSATLDALNRTFVMSEGKPPLWPLVVEERCDLERLDIPVFHAHTNGRAVYHCGRRIVEEQFAESGLDAVRARITAMNADDMDVQLTAARRALWDSLDARFATPLVLPASNKGQPPAPDAEIVAHAMWIAAELSAVAADPPEGARLEDCHLYDGHLGPALLHAAIASTTGDEDSRQRALAVLDTIEPAIETSPVDAALGICSGDGSLIYGLICLARLLDSHRAEALAVRIAARVTRERLSADHVLDVSGGVAGAGMALLALHQHTGDPAALARAVECGERLVATSHRRESECSWRAADGRRYVGFAHGAAGIAVALIRLFRATGRRDFLDAAAGAHQFEKRLYQGASGNWPVTAGDDGGPGEMMTAWCHGAPGLALARALAATALQDRSLLADVTAALETTASVPVRLDDHLCCGSMGRSDVLLTVGEMLRAPASIEAAWRLGLGVVRRAGDEGRYRLTSRGYEFRAFDPGFFRGLSGIGYGLLRLAAPSRLPSILAFELPPPVSRS